MGKKASRTGKGKNEEEADGKNTFLHIIGENVQRLRRGRRLTLEQLSMLTGQEVSLSKIYALEEAVHEPRLRTVCHLAAALGVDLSEIVNTKAWRALLKIKGDV